MLAYYVSTVYLCYALWSDAFVCLSVQAEAYIASQNGTIPSDALYIVYIGANDYLYTIAGPGNATVEEVLMYTGEAMDMLYTAGARV